MKATFVETWSRILRCEGQMFRTVTGEPVSYTVERGGIRPSRTDYLLTRGNFEKAYRLMPVSGPGALGRAVRGQSYVWAILSDPRITG